MNAERIARLLDARPFKPFVVYTNSSSDEGTFIDEPELAKIEDEGETLIVTSHRARSERWTKLSDIGLVVMIAVHEGKRDRE